MDNQSKHIVAFVRYERDISYILEKIKADGVDQSLIQFIALTTDAMFWLEDKGIHYKIPADFSKKSERNTLSWEGHNRLEVFLVKISDALKLSYGITAAQLVYHERDIFKKLFDGFLIRVDEVYHILDALKPNTVWAGQLSYGYDGPFDLSKIPFYDGILKFFAALQGWDLNGWPQKTKRQIVKRNFFMDLKTKTKYFLLYWFIELNNFKSYILSSIFKRTLVLSLDSIHGNWPVALKQLTKSKLANIVYFNCGRSSKSIILGSDLGEKVITIIENDVDLKVLFEYRGLNYSSLVKPFLKKYYNDVFPMVYGHYLNARRFLQSGRVSLVVTSQMTSPERKAMLEAAREAKVSICDWHHGGSVGYLKKPSDVWNTASGMSNYLFAFGKGDKKWFESNGTGAISFAVGCPGIHNLWHTRKNWKYKKEKKKELVLILTNISEEFRYLVSSSTYSDTLMCANAMSILKIIREYVPKYFLTLKLHPQEKRLPIEKWIKIHFPQNAYRIIHRELSVEDLTKTGDLFINIIPSTTLLQTLCSDKNVFVYNGEMTFEEEALYDLEKRVFYSDSIEQLCGLLDSFLKLGDFNLYKKDNTFLLKFGINSEDEFPSLIAFNNLKYILESQVVNSSN